MKTIRQIADEIGVSKQALQWKLKKEPLASTIGKQTTKKGNTTYIDNVGVDLIKKAYSTNTNDKQTTNTNDVFVDVLRKEIEFLQAQIIEKDKQIDFLQTAFTNQQLLHGGTIKQQLIGSTEGEASADERGDTPPKRTKHRIFGIFTRK